MDKLYKLLNTMLRSESLRWARPSMNWLEATVLGAVGGAIVQLVTIFGGISVWKKARYKLLVTKGRPLPPLTGYMDISAETLVGLTRLCMGALAGATFHGQVTGVTAAITVGASAPALLAQFTTGRMLGSLQVGGVEDINIGAMEDRIVEREVAE